MKFYSDIEKALLYKHLSITGHNNFAQFPIVVFSDASFQGGGIRVIRLARNGAGGTYNRIKATILICSRFTSRTIERGGSVRVLSRFDSDTVRRSAMVPWKMVDKVGSRTGKLHSDC
jgi:hypothetical protein